MRRRDARPIEDDADVLVFLMFQPVVSLLRLLRRQRMTMQRRDLQVSVADEVQRQRGIARNRMLDERIMRHRIAPFVRAFEGQVAAAVKVDMLQHRR